MEQELNKIKLMVEPLCKQADCELYDIEYNNQILTILIDSKEGIDLDKCVLVSELISKELDKFDPIKEEYTLEVASAGCERPLVTKEQYIQAIDSYIQVHTTKLYEGYDELVGYLRAVNDDSIELEIKIKTRKLTIKILNSDIIDSMTTVDF